MIDRKTRFFVANENDSASSLIQMNNVFTGYFPENLIIANSTTDFNGKKWTMVAYPLPANNDERNTLFLHEMFHRFQPVLWKNYKTDYSNSHMNNKQARILLKLEWNALVKAVNSSKRENIHCLIFNNHFRSFIFTKKYNSVRYIEPIFR